MGGSTIFRHNSYLFPALRLNTSTKHANLSNLEPKACGRPEQPPNSTMVAARGFDVGATVDYGCDEGHLLVGPATRACMDTGFYNEFPPVCKCMYHRNHVP